ncbi:MAG: AmmeMemoRadiSam system protein B [Candidatus Aminicenantes bacterium]|nr:AmmeMemoRadiSam system protein B [Candidatus Aminicenantes bacterium]
MKPHPPYIEDMSKTWTAVGMLLIIGAGTAGGQGLRPPVWAGQFYDADPSRLGASIEAFLSAAAPSAPPGEVKALIVPHAGYVYSGPTAGFGYKLVRGKDVETVVILGPSHRIGFHGASIWPDGGYATPLGPAAVDAEAASLLTKAGGFVFVPEAHAEEHSVEVQVPFIQKTLPKAKIVPVVLGYPSEPTIRRLAAALAELSRSRRILVVASTDLSHFLSREKAGELDRETVEMIRGMKTGPLLRDIQRPESNRMCGGAAVLTALLYAEKEGRPRVEILRTADSTEGGGPADRVVGYMAAAVMAGGPTPEPPFSLSAGEKKDLLRLARKAVETYVRSGEIVDDEGANPNFRTPRAAFVTLKKDGQLRGCVGHAEPVLPLSQNVIRCAVFAATQDPRFPPVSAAELRFLSYEISVLTPLRKIDDPRLVRVGRHGLVVVHDESRGLLLPQVAAENGWRREEFLAQACLKAGLPADAWRKGAEIYVFEALVFR